MFYLAFVLAGAVPAHAFDPLCPFSALGPRSPQGQLLADGGVRTRRIEGGVEITPKGTHHLNQFAARARTRGIRVILSEDPTLSRDGSFESDGSTGTLYLSRRVVERELERAKAVRAQSGARAAQNLSFAPAEQESFKNSEYSAERLAQALQAAGMQGRVEKKGEDFLVRPGTGHPLSEFAARFEKMGVEVRFQPEMKGALFQAGNKDRAPILYLPFNDARNAPPGFLADHEGDHGTRDFYLRNGLASVYHGRVTGQRNAADGFKEMLPGTNIDPLYQQTVPLDEIYAYGRMASTMARHAADALREGREMDEVQPFLENWVAQAARSAEMTSYQVRYMTYLAARQMGWFPPQSPTVSARLAGLLGRSVPPPAGAIESVTFRMLPASDGPNKGMGTLVEAEVNLPEGHLTLPMHQTHTPSLLGAHINEAVGVRPGEPVPERYERLASEMMWGGTRFDQPFHGGAKDQLTKNGQRLLDELTADVVTRMQVTDVAEPLQQLKEVSLSQPANREALIRELEQAADAVDARLRPLGQDSAP